MNAQKLTIKRKKPKSAGQGLLEFALIAPVLLLLLMGVIDFGWMLFNYSQLYNGLREGLRYGSVPGYTSVEQFYQCDTIRRQIEAMAGSSGIKATNIQVYYDDGRPFSGPGPAASEVGECPGGTGMAPNTTYTPQGASSAKPQTTLIDGDRVVIDVDVNVQFLTPFIHIFAPGGMRLHLRSARTVSFGLS